MTTRCPYCDARGSAHSGRHFEVIGTPMGGDPVYACTTCRSRLLMVPGRFRPRFHIITPDGWSVLATALPENQPGCGARRVFTDEARQSLRCLPWSTPARDRVFGRPSALTGA